MTDNKCSPDIVELNQIVEQAEWYASVDAHAGLAFHLAKHWPPLRAAIYSHGAAQRATDPIQEIHDAVNALGGRPDQDNSYDQGIVDTVAKVLEIIERAQAVSSTDREGK